MFLAAMRFREMLVLDFLFAFEPFSKGIETRQYDWARRPEEGSNADGI